LRRSETPEGAGVNSVAVGCGLIGFQQAKFLVNALESTARRAGTSQARQRQIACCPYAIFPGK